MKKDVISLEDTLQKCCDYLDGRISSEEFYTWVSHLTIKPYLTLREKQDIIRNILIINSTNDMTYTAIFLTDIEIDLLFYGLLAYTNIKINDEDLISSQSYDILMQTLVDSILPLCVMDYQRLQNMLYKTIDIKNLLTFSELFESPNPEVLNAQKESVTEIINEMNKNPQTIDKILEILSKT